MTDDQLRELAKELPFERPTAARRDAVRSSLLVEAAEVTIPVVTPRRWPIAAGFCAGALAAAAIAVLVLRRPAPVLERSNLTQVTATSELRVEHQIIATETGSDEVVRFRDGTIALAIPAQRRGDRLVVKTTTAEVEGDAGELEVTVTNDQLQAVRVKTGTARVIVIGQTPVILSAGQTWRASVITADLTPPPQPAPVAATAPSSPEPVTPPSEPIAPIAPSRAPDPTSPPIARTPDPIARTAPSPAPAPSPAVPSPAPAPTSQPAEPSLATSGSATPPVAAIAPAPATIEQRFQRGWALLREGKAQQAADALGAAADASPDSPLAADARYFQAVALVRANDPRTAERVLVQFLDGAPRSLRRGRAAVLLGRLIAERGDPKGARAWLETAATDPDPAIAAAAKAGLQTLK